MRTLQLRDHRQMAKGSARPISVPEPAISVHRTWSSRGKSTRCSRDATPRRVYVRRPAVAQEKATTRTAWHGSCRTVYEG